jgi:hypothetical protein
MKRSVHFIGAARSDIVLKSPLTHVKVITAEGNLSPNGTCQRWQLVDEGESQQPYINQIKVRTYKKG